MNFINRLIQAANAKVNSQDLRKHHCESPPNSPTLGEVNRVPPSFLTKGELAGRMHKSCSLLANNPSRILECQVSEVQLKQDSLKAQPDPDNSDSLISTSSKSIVDAQLEALCYFCS
ncbi:MULTISPECIES: hypothetical protein [unclassified Coleofasciculus]|uniref:hypothetical protein n=1 Tax=unclassified Coleofasciculus TaxID=2692782 RepID=UPI00187E9C85|nr:MULTISPECIES: hypothetical protein [unclassified Coleofasciculus]MBE9124928.1 hypothetical protein [Coleofasciculus sp. LEGE 07081]MBE9147952.1 hypothetical protein [Coleofasciculus sp. LEGE 07092]